MIVDTRKNNDTFVQIMYTPWEHRVGAQCEYVRFRGTFQWTGILNEIKSNLMNDC